MHGERPKSVPLPYDAVGRVPKGVPLPYDLGRHCVPVGRVPMASVPLPYDLR